MKPARTLLASVPAAYSIRPGQNEFWKKHASVQSSVPVARSGCYPGIAMRPKATADPSTVPRFPVKLSEDEVDVIISERRLAESKTIPASEIFEEFGYVPSRNGPRRAARP